MKQFALRKLLVISATGLSVLFYPYAARSQEAPKKQESRPQVSDKELRAFVKAYVEYHKIRQEYEPALKKAKNSEQAKKIQDEANSKIEKALHKQGLDATAYNRLFSAVNADEKLRQDALKLIEKERGGR